MGEKSEIFHSYLDAISNQNLDKLRLIIHPRAKFEYPYALQSSVNFINGLEEIIPHLVRPHFTITFHKKKITEVPDSNLVIAELISTEFYLKTSKSYDQHTISLATFRENRIYYYKEFFNPITRIEGLLDLEKDD